MNQTLQNVVTTLNPDSLLGALLIAAMLAVVGVLMSWAINRALTEAILHDRSERVDEITLQFVNRLLLLGMWLVMLTLYAHLIPTLNRVSSALLAGVGLMSVVIGFAAQQTLGNLVAGISLVLYKPFRRGDRLQVVAPATNGFEVGTVTDISLGFTMLKTDDGREIIVANSTMAQQTMIKIISTAHVSKQTS